MAIAPEIVGASFYKDHILLGIRPLDQNIESTNLIDSVLDPEQFSVTVNGRSVEVISAKSDVAAILMRQ